jgi:hypothetical protein
VALHTNYEGVFHSELAIDGVLFKGQLCSSQSSCKRRGSICYSSKEYFIFRIIDAETHTQYVRFVAQRTTKTTPKHLLYPGSPQLILNASTGFLLAARNDSQLVVSQAIANETSPEMMNTFMPGVIL